MGFLSKLLGGLGEKAVDELAEYYKKSDMKKAADTAASASSLPESVYADEDDYWGSVPEAENQYNSGLEYNEYFMRLFAENYPSYTVSQRTAYGDKATIFTFADAGETRLVVEVMSDRCSARKLRSDCQAQGIPYLRFYHDHFGWWNEKSYVLARVNNALGY